MLARKLLAVGDAVGLACGRSHGRRSSRSGAASARRSRRATCSRCCGERRAARPRERALLPAGTCSSWAAPPPRGADETRARQTRRRAGLARSSRPSARRRAACAPAGRAVHARDRTAPAGSRDRQPPARAVAKLAGAPATPRQGSSSTSAWARGPAGSPLFTVHAEAPASSRTRSTYAGHSCRRLTPGGSGMSAILLALPGERAWHRAGGGPRRSGHRPLESATSPTAIGQREPSRHRPPVGGSLPPSTGPTQSSCRSCWPPRRAGAGSEPAVGLVARYLAYLRQDRRFLPGEGVTAVYFARLLSPAIDWLVTVDPHSIASTALASSIQRPPLLAARGAASRRLDPRHQSCTPLLIGPDQESGMGRRGAAADGGRAGSLVLDKVRRGDRGGRGRGGPWASSASPAGTPVLVDDIVSTG